MRLFDTNPQSWSASGVGKFDGGTYELSQDDITKSFSKAKKMALIRMKCQLKELNDQVEKVERMTEESCPVISNPYA